MKKTIVLDKYETVSIAELISRLINLIEEGCETVRIETCTRYNGINGTGEDEFPYEFARLVTEEKD